MNIEYRNAIRETLRRHLIGNKNAQNEIIEKLHVTSSAIKGWISPSSTAIPSAEDLITICDTLNIDLYELYGIDNPDNLSPEYRKLFNYMKENPDKANLVFNMFMIERDK